MKKSEKETRLSSLWNNNTTEGEFNVAVEDLKRKILVPAFLNAIEASRFEIIHWKIKRDKYAGKG